MLDGRLGHLRRHGPRAGQGGVASDRRLRRLHRRRRRGRHGGGRVALRDPVDRPAGGRLDRGTGGRDRPVLDRWTGGHQLGQPRRRRRRGHPARLVPLPGQGVRRGGRVHLHRHRGTGPHRGVEGPGCQGDPRHRGRALRAPPERPALRPSGASALDRDGGEPARRHRDHRGHPPDQGRAPRRLHRPRALQRLVRAQSRGPPGAQLGLPPRVRRGRARRGHRARVEDPPAVEDRRADPRGLPRPRLRPPPRRLRPADRAARPLRGGVQLVRGGRRGPVRMAGRAAPRAPDRRRRPQRARRGPRRGHDRRHGAARHHQRRAAGGHEDGRRPVRLGRDAASLRARLRRDHEDMPSRTSSPTWRRPIKAARGSWCSPP